MITDFEDLRTVLRVLFAETPPPKPLHLIEPVARVRAGAQSLRDAARQAGTTTRRLQELATAVDPLSELLGAEVPAWRSGFESRVRSQIRNAQWFVLSARRADRLLRDLLFDRAYALRVRAFARNYPGAELDMHFSLAEDLRPLEEFLHVLRDHGMPGLVSRLERGTL